MPTQTEVESRLRRSLHSAAATTNVDADWDSFSELLEVVEGTLPTLHPADKHRSPLASRPVLIVVSAFVGVVVAIGLTGLVNDGSAPGAPPSDPQSEEAAAGGGWTQPTISEQQLEEGGPVPQAAQDYWALDGTLESVGTEPGWLCPPRPNTGYGFVLDVADTPSELAFELSGQTPVSSGTRDMGPSCEQPAALVLLAFSDNTGLEASAGAAVWPSLTGLNDLCPPDSCAYDGRADLSAGLFINDRSARFLEYHGNYELWWTDSNGVPMHGVFSGMSENEIIALAEKIHVDPITHVATFPTSLPAGLGVVSHDPSVGVWKSTVSHGHTYEIGDTRVHISARLADAQAESSTVYTRLAANVDFIELVDIDGMAAVWVPEGENYLTFQTIDGVEVTIAGAHTKEDAIEIARDLKLTHPRPEH